MADRHLGFYNKFEISIADGVQRGPVSHSAKFSCDCLIGPVHT